MLVEIFMPMMHAFLALHSGADVVIEEIGYLISPTIDQVVIGSYDWFNANVHRMDPVLTRVLLNHALLGVIMFYPLMLCSVFWFLDKCVSQLKHVLLRARDGAHPLHSGLVHDA